MDKRAKEESAKLKKFLLKPETKETVGLLVNQFKEVFGMDWFTIADCTQVFRQSSIEQLVDIIRTLDLCGFIITNNDKVVERYRLSMNAIPQENNVSTK